jgi:hypothetical protein
MAVLVGMVLAGFCRVMCCLDGMPVGDVRMMTGFLMASLLMVLRGGEMVLRCVFVMLCCAPMVFGGFFGHASPP